MNGGDSHNLHRILAVHLLGTGDLSPSSDCFANTVQIKKKKKFKVGKNS